jgi:transposase InsO family protein
MRGDVHVRFGGRVDETERPKGRHRTSTRPYTYLRCWEGVVYFAFVIDAYSRAIVGWQLAAHMRTDLVLDACGWRLPGAGRAPMSRSSITATPAAQYTSFDYTQTLDDHGVLASIGTVGDGRGVYEPDPEHGADPL